MADKTWATIWHQAITGSFLGGKAFGWHKTVAFSLTSSAAGGQLLADAWNLEELLGR